MKTENLRMIFVNTTKMKLFRLHLAFQDAQKEKKSDFDR